MDHPGKRLPYRGIKVKSQPRGALTRPHLPASKCVFGPCIGDEVRARSFHWGATDHVAGKTVQWLYERLHKEGTQAVIERDPTGSVLNLSMPSARYLTAGAAGLVGTAGGAPGALVFGGLGIAPTAAWERRVVKRFFKGIERRLDGLDPGPDPLILFDKRR